MRACVRVCVCVCVRASVIICACVDVGEREGKCEIYMNALLN